MTIRRRYRVRAAIVIALLLLLTSVSCWDSPNSGGAADYDYGYGDGYASGYNTTCNIRDTLVKGDWENEDYTAGFRAGEADGSLQCITDRQSRKSD